jgi:hypothetical protein
MTNLDPAAIHQALGAHRWQSAYPFGPAGFVFDTRSSHPSSRSRVIVSDGPAPDAPDGPDWRHASISRPNRDPDYDELVLLHRAVWGQDGYAYQVFAARSEHVNIHHHALHLWGTPDGARLLPAFGLNGSI